MEFDQDQCESQIESRWDRSLVRSADRYLKVRNFREEVERLGGVRKLLLGSVSRGAEILLAGRLATRLDEEGVGQLYGMPDMDRRLPGIARYVTDSVTKSEPEPKAA